MRGRDFYIIMASFVVLMIAMVILLGSIDDLQVNYRDTFSQMDDAYGAQGASRTVREPSAYPWQLDDITLGTKLEIAYASMPNYLLPYKEEHRVK